MKQILLLLAFCGFFAVLDANAQSCTKSAAAKAAALDQNIVKKVSTSGDVTYVRKKVCPATGEVTYTNVEYCSRSGQFIPVSASYTKPSCSKSMASCSKYYSKNAMAATYDTPSNCTAAMKAACLQANQKTQAAKAAFASLDNRVVKP
ncbi:MAG: hypothetical protein ACK4TA_22490 [Saprospiraceae bacterium]